MRVERDNVVMAVLCGDDWFQTFFYSSLDHKAVAVVTTWAPHPNPLTLWSSGQWAHFLLIQSSKLTGEGEDKLKVELQWISQV